ncbi:MAG: hypothetical protein E7105_07620 [Prevotella sp.]|nr:hypothetical protein [Prevotella sp.]
MKKIYQAPAMIAVKLHVENHLMDLSGGGSASIKSGETDGDGFTKDQGSWGNLWGSNDDEE